MHVSGDLTVGPVTADQPEYRRTQILVHNDHNCPKIETYF